MVHSSILNLKTKYWRSEQHLQSWDRFSTSTVQVQVVLPVQTDLLADLSINKDDVVQSEDEFGDASCLFVLPVISSSAGVVSTVTNSQQDSVIPSDHLIQ